MAYVPSTTDPITDILRGARPGYLIDRKFGRNQDVRQGNVPQDIIAGASGAPGGLYAGHPLGGSAETVTIVSSATTDNLAGTGARQITVTGLDDNYALQTEVIVSHASDGTIPTSGSLNFRRVFKAEVTASGSSNTNDGNITVRHTTTSSNIFAVINIGTSQSEILVYTVPANTVLIIKYLLVEVEEGSPSGAEIETTLRLTDIDSEVVRTIAYYEETRGNPMIINYGYGFAIPEKTDIIYRIDLASSASQTLVSGEFGFQLAPMPA